MPLEMPSEQSALGSLEYGIELMEQLQNTKESVNLPIKYAFELLVGN